MADKINVLIPEETVDAKIKEIGEQMCIRDSGYREGQEKGEKQKLVRVVTKMHEAEFPLEQIAAIAEISVERVKEIID